MTRLALACALACLPACRTRPHASSTSRVAPLRVPRATGTLDLDGEPDEAAWQRAARTGPFLDGSGAPARPFTEVRFLRDDRALYLHLYAADDDLRCPKVGADGPVWLCDRFRVTFHAADGDRTLEVTPRGELADERTPSGKSHADRSWTSHAHLGADSDGTLDDPRDDDEEWAVELAVPLEDVAAELDHATVTVERVDVGGKDRRRAPLRYDATLVLTTS